MKKFLHIGKTIAFTAALLITAAAVNAQTKTATTDGPWNSTTTWGGQAVPTASEDVRINPGVDVTLSSGNNAVCKSLTFMQSTSSTASTISVSAGYSLSVTDAITLQNAADNNRSATISGAGTVTAGSLVVGGTITSVTKDATTTLTTTVALLSISGDVSVNAEDNGSDDNDARFVISSGEVTVGGTLTIDSDNSSGATGTITLASGSQNGKLVVTGATPFVLTGSGSETVSFNGTSATVEYNGATQDIWNTTYRNLIVSGTGTKTLDGTVNATFTVGGNVELAGSVSYGSSAILKYNGTAAQTTTSAEFPATMNADVEIDNANGVTLNGAKTLSGSLTLTNGVLNTTDVNVLIFPDGFSTVNGGSVTSYVTGPVRKVGNDASFTYPVGKEGVFAPVTITGPESNSDAFTVEYKRQSASIMGPIAAALNGELFAVSNCEFWDINETTASGTANSINITVSWSAGSGCGGAYITDITKLTLAHFNGTEWDSYGGTASGTTSNGTITRTGVTSFSPFALGSTSFSANPLPVAFSDVKAFQKGNAVQIDWTNLTESDMSVYVIERSANGIDFTTIGTVAPRSNQVDKVSYTYLDMTPLTGAGFYRIKAVELTGKNVYTKSLKVMIGQGPKGIVLYPNPVQGSDVNISFTANRGIYQLNVLNAAGQVVYRQQLNHAGGTVAQTLSLPSSLKAGVYSLLVSGENYKETTRFVVQ